MRRPLLLLMTVAALLGAAAPASHAAGWVDTGTLSPPDKTAVDAHLLLLPNGERVVAWVQQTGLSPTPENVSVRVAPPGGGFGPTQTFPSQAFELSVAAGADGTVALAWTTFPHTLHIARLAPGDTSFTDVAFGVPGDEGIFGAEIAVTGGDVYATLNSFSQGMTSTSSIWALRLAAGASEIHIVPGPAGAGNPLAHATFTSPSPDVFLSGAAIAADGGRVDIAWQRENEGVDPVNGTTNVVEAIRTPTLGDAFGSPQPLDTIQSNSASADSVTPNLVAGFGHIYALWPRQRAGQIAFRDLTGMGATQTVPINFSDTIRAGVDPTGALIAAYTDSPLNVEANMVSAFIAPLGAPVPTPTPLTPRGFDRTIDDLAVAPDGTALLLADREGTFDDATQVSALIRPPGGAFGPAEEVSGLRDTAFEQSHVASAAVGSGGRALVLWEAADNTGTTNQRLHLSERDSTPPTFGAINVPATATAGRPVALSADATDALSGAATVRWDFGDGSQAGGASVSHTFGVAGSMTVTVTATDSVGNTTTQTRTVAVAPAPVTATTTTTPGPDHTPPVVSKLAVSHARFRVAKAATARIATHRTTKKAKTAAGTTFSFRLSERATVAMTIAGHTLVRGSVAPGSARVAFSGRIGSTALRPGAYRVSVVAIDGAGNRSRPVSAKFTIVGGSR